MPRAGLSGPIVIEEASRLADEHGLPALTLSSIAGRFRVAVPSLYKHVASLEDVRRGVAIEGLRGLGAALDDAHDLRDMARAYRAYALAHPGRYAATVRAAREDDTEHQAVGAAVMVVVNRTLAGRGLTGPVAIDAARLLRATLHGFVTLELGGGFAMARDLETSFEAALDALEAGLDALAGRELAAGPRAPRGRRWAALSRARHDWSHAGGRHAAATLSVRPTPKHAPPEEGPTP